VPDSAGTYWRLQGYCLPRVPRPVYLEFTFLRGSSGDIVLSSRKRTKRSRKFFPSSPIPESICSVKPESSNFEIFVVFLFLLRISSLPIDKLGDIFSKIRAKLYFAEFCLEFVYWHLLGVYTFIGKSILFLYS
jgi:hypothetical protein